MTSIISLQTLPRALLCTIALMGAVSTSMSASATTLRDMAYGPDNDQRMDIYLPDRATNAAVIFMVHGGAWRFGDKDNSRVVNNKAKRWVSQGVIFITVNYRMLPDADVLEQAKDVARALAFAQSKATTWGGDPNRFVLMGHSAGAHLVTLLAVQPSKAFALGAKPWLGTVSLDSGAMNVPAIMQGDHARLYDKAFGKDPAFWRATSPLHQLTDNVQPILAVCSTKRRDNPCKQAHDFAHAASAKHIRVEVIEQALSHSEINGTLGKESAYTGSVEAFLKSLDPTILGKH
jgi:arylformamidase